MWFSAGCVTAAAVSVSKALQEFDFALRGKKKREKFVKDAKKKELSVRSSNS